MLKQPGKGKKYAWLDFQESKIQKKQKKTKIKCMYF